MKPDYYRQRPIKALKRPSTIEDFKQDFHERIASAHLYIRDNIVEIYMSPYVSNEINTKEERNILKIVKVRYSKLLRRIPSENNSIIKFKINYTEK